MREGICIAGNLAVDILFEIESYPGKSESAKVTHGIVRSIAGSAFNVAINLAKLDPLMPLIVIGKIGDDADADFIEEQLEEYENIQVTNIRRQGVTSFNVVMKEKGTNISTFFQYPGGNAELSENDFNWKKINSKILHVGDVLLLESLNKPDKEHGSKLAMLLFEAQNEGIITSVDLINKMDDTSELDIPSILNYTDYCLISEHEAQKITGIPLRHGNDFLVEENIQKVLKKLFLWGVTTRVVLLTPEAGFGMDKQNHFVKIKNTRPDLYSKDTADAFCAGILYGVYVGMDMNKAIFTSILACAPPLIETKSTKGTNNLSFLI